MKQFACFRSNFLVMTNVPVSWPTVCLSVCLSQDFAVQTSLKSSLELLETFGYPSMPKRGFDFPTDLMPSLAICWLFNCYIDLESTMVRCLLCTGMHLDICDLG